MKNLLITVLALWLLFSDSTSGFDWTNIQKQLLSWVKVSEVTPVPSRVYPTPTPEFLAQAQTITALLKANSSLPNYSRDMALIADFYSTFAETFADSKDLTFSTASFKSAITQAGKNFFSKYGIDNKYPGLSDAIETVLRISMRIPIGMIPVRELTAEDITRIVAGLNSVAWAANEATK